jgi:hypothetical protein
MSLDPNERLEALRREIEAETPPAPAGAAPAVPLPEAPPTTPVPAIAADLPPAAVVTATSPTADAESASEAPASTAAASLKGEPERTGSDATNDGGWDLSSLMDTLAEGGLAQWLGIGLLALGGYLVLSLFVPGIEFIGSLLLLAAGIVLLALHFANRAAAWALYVGAVLTGIGALRVIGELLPFETEGLTALGLGLGFLGIAYLRQTQAGGYGWQGVVGVGAVGLGLLQFAVGLLPGDTGLFDLIVPVIILGIGALILMRLVRPRTA